MMPNFKLQVIIISVRIAGSLFKAYSVWEIIRWVGEDEGRDIWIPKLHCCEGAKVYCCFFVFFFFPEFKTASLCKSLVEFFDAIYFIQTIYKTTSGWDMYLWVFFTMSFLKMVLHNSNQYILSLKCWGIRPFWYMHAIS